MALSVIFLVITRFYNIISCYDISIQPTYRVGPTYILKGVRSMFHYYTIKVESVSIVVHTCVIV